MVFNATFWSFSIYLVVVYGLAWLAWRKTQDHSDFILGGRQLGANTGALSASASDMSGWLLLGLPGYAYSVGLSSLWLALGLLLGTSCNWQIVAPRLRKTTAEMNCLTLPTWFHKQHPQGGAVIRLISALLILFFFLLYSAAGLAAGGKLFVQLLDLPYPTAVLLCTLVVASYALIGGFLAVSWSDVLQGLLMLGALLLVPYIALQAITESPNLIQQVRARSDLFYFTYDEAGRPMDGLAILSLLAWGLGYFGQPHILARFQAMKSQQAVARGKLVAVTWTAAALAGAIAVGISGAILLNPPPGDPEQVFLALVEHLFSPWVAGFLLAAVLAAIMSTADSQLLICSAAFSEDLMPMLRRQFSNNIVITRATMLVFAILASLVALQPETSVLQLVAYAWAGFGASFGPPLLATLYLKFTNATGVISAMVIGSLTVVIWRQLEGGLFELYELVPGFALSTITVIGVSFVTRTTPGTQLGAD